MNQKVISIYWFGRNTYTGKVKTVFPSLIKFLIFASATLTDGSILMYYGYTYGNAGEKTQVIEAVRESAEEETARVVKTEYGYDALFRLTDEVIRVNASVPFATFDITDISSVSFSGNIHNQYTYDAVSNRTAKITSVTGNVCGLDENIQTGTTNYTYNSVNQLTCASYVSDEEDGSDSDYTITYTYDRNGNLLSEHGGSDDKNYTYNAKNQLTTVTVSQNNAVTIESYTYDYEGNRISKQLNEESRVYYLNDTYDSLTQVHWSFPRIRIIHIV